MMEALKALTFPHPSIELHSDRCNQRSLSKHGQLDNGTAPSVQHSSVFSHSYLSFIGTYHLLFATIPRGRLAGSYIQLLRQHRHVKDALLRPYISSMREQGPRCAAPTCVRLIYSSEARTGPPPQARIKIPAVRHDYHRISRRRAILRVFKSILTMRR